MQVSHPALANDIVSVELALRVSGQINISSCQHSFGLYWKTRFKNQPCYTQDIRLPLILRNHLLARFSTVRRRHTKLKPSSLYLACI